MIMIAIKEIRITMTYWDIQVQLIGMLRQFGFHYKLLDRVPIFKVYRKIDLLKKRLPKQEKILNDIKELLELQLSLRIAGLEPPLETPTRYVGSGT
jgi:hypothetical protein